VGTAVGARVGICVGRSVGVAVGAALGVCVGVCDGANDGLSVVGGFVVGTSVGRTVGNAVGRSVGVLDGVSGGLVRARKVTTSETGDMVGALVPGLPGLSQEPSGRSTSEPLIRLDCFSAPEVLLLTQHTSEVLLCVQYLQPNVARHRLQHFDGLAD